MVAARRASRLADMDRIHCDDGRWFAGVSPATFARRHSRDFLECHSRESGNPGWRAALQAFCLCLSLLFAAFSAFGQSNPVPFVNQPLVPSAVAPGGPSFTLTVNGTGFVSGATVNWNGTPLATTFVSSSQVTAVVPATDTALVGTASITVLNPAKTSTSNAAFLQVTLPPISLSFQSEPVFSGSTSNVGPIATADFNGDGLLDVAVAAAGAVSVLLGNGDGSFRTPVEYAVMGCPYSIIVADVNGDGKLDLVVADGCATSVSILLGNGDGTFQPGVNYPAGSDQVVAIVAADFNGDGKLDLAVAAGEVEILLGNGDGTFQPPVPYTVGFFPVIDIAVGDFNGDGNLDIAAVGAAPAVSVLLGNGDGTFRPPTEVQLPEYPFRILTADVNSDGKLDLLAAGPTELFVVLGNGDGTFRTPANFPTVGALAPSAMAVADLNADGKVDVVLTPAPDPEAPKAVRILLGNGDGTFQAPLNFTAGISPASIATGDFNRDGRLDLVLGDYQSNSMSVVLQSSFVQLAPPSFAFGDQHIGTPSFSQTVTLTNNLTGALDILSITLTGANAGQFIETNDCPTSPTTLASAGSCAITASFVPSTTGAMTATVTISDNIPFDPQQTVSLRGNAINPIVTLSTTSLSFSSQPVSTTSAAQPVTVTNSGTTALTFSGITASGDFAQTNNCPVSPATLAVNANCIVNVTFTPTAPGTRAGFLTITDNAVASPQTVSLTGTGVAPTASASPASLSFGNQAVGTSSTSQAVTLTNGASGPLTISSVGTSNGGFTQTNTCPIPPATLAAGNSCTISVTFKPSANGAESGTLTINDNAAASPQTVSLGGTGQAPVAALSSASLDFPGQTVGMTSAPESVMLTNSGSLPLTISATVVTSPFAIASSSCPVSPATLAAGANCAINVTFTAGFAGTTYGSLLVSDNSLGSASQTVSLTGEATVSFGPQLAGTTSAPQAVTVANGSTTKTVTVTGVSATGDFAVASNPCGALPPGGSCNPTVTFKPTKGGTRTGTLVITDTSPGSPHSVPVTGMGQDFAVAPSQPSATINAGGTATFTLSIAPQGGFNQTVNLSCALPAMMTLATCNVSPMAVIPISATPVAATVTITTTAATMVAPTAGKHRGLPLQFVWLLGLGVLLAVAAVYARRSLLTGKAAAHRAALQQAAMGTSPLQRFALAVTLLLVLAWAACGGSTVVHMAGTPPGIYTISITAADPQASLTHTNTVTLTVSQ